MTAAQPPGQGSQGETSGDPSMEDILASIRRILSEDDAKPASGGASVAMPHDPADDILMLDASMLVAEPSAPAPAPVQASAPAPTPAALPPAPPYFGPAPIVAPIAAPIVAPLAAPPVSPAAPLTVPVDPILVTGPSAPNPSPAEGLVAPEAAAATAAAVGALLRHLRVERETSTHRGGPTIEDIVREEMRPLLKQWLDAHMPPIVERLVRAEIERVVARSVS